MKEFTMYVMDAYDEYLMQTEGRGISYGEINYIQNLNKKEMQELLNELQPNERDLKWILMILKNASQTQRQTSWT